MKQRDGQPVEGKTAAIIGFFDGVHLGHQALLRRLLEVSREGGLLPTVLTFDPHPAAVLQPDRAPLLLTSLAQKEALLRSTGVAKLVHCPSTGVLPVFRLENLPFFSFRL